MPSAGHDAPLPPELRARIDALIVAMTPEEKVGQLTMATGEGAVTGPVVSTAYVSEIRAGRVGSILNLWGAETVREIQRVAVEETRLGVPILCGFDVLHGHRTIFPVPIAEAGAFDPDLWKRTAELAAAEAAADGIDLTFAPMLDVGRDPRWGRIVEGAGEDPWLGARFGEAKVRGFQGADPADPARIAATAKHFVGYGAVAGGREYASSDLSARTLREVHLPPFQAAVAAGAAAVMPAFVDIAGVPMNAHRLLLEGTLRRGWGFDGVLISDYNAISELVAHGIAGDLAEAAALALRAGIDIDMMGGAYRDGLATALARGAVVESQIDAAVRRVLLLKARLGLFDDPHRRTTAAAGPGPQEGRALAREAAGRAVVLLKNDGLLPLRPGLASIALIGPFADARAEMLGPWSGAGRAEEAVSFREGLQAALPATAVLCVEGAPADREEAGGVEAALALARDSDLTVLCLGEPAWMSGEGGSRTSLELPGRQRELAEAVLDLGKPLVAVLTGGRPLAVPWLVERAGAVLATFFLGSEAGHGLADVLTGRRSPSGRLTMSWPRSVGQVPVFFAQRPTGRPGIAGARYTSRYIDCPNEPLFPFGHGLTYTRFAFADLRVSPERPGGSEPLCVSVDVTNEGERQGEETVFVFLRASAARIAPAMQLRGFARLRLAPGETRTTTVAIAADELLVLDEELRPGLPVGPVTVYAGPSADPERLLQTVVPAGIT